MRGAYYNENDPAAVFVLRHLIAEGLIADGEVDDRSIVDVRPAELAGFTQCHFFAGAGVWSVAARLAGWPDDRPLWTGSCPCQPFSGIGKRGGTDDPRHLWPDFFRLIRGASAAGYGPPVVMGEQVSGAVGYGWFDGVRADLVSEGYTSRARDVPACAVDAPHIRHRLFWCAVGDAERTRLERQRRDGDDGNGPGRLDALPSRPVAPPDGRNGSAWSGAEWISCHDGKARRTEPGLRLLALGVPGRVQAWHLGGNSIVAPLAAEVIGALMDVLPWSRGSAP